MPPHTSFTEDQRLEIKSIVHEALVEFFRSYGLKGKGALMTVAVVIGSLTVILGGFKAVLALFGFTYLGGK